MSGSPKDTSILARAEASPSRFPSHDLYAPLDLRSTDHYAGAVQSKLIEIDLQLDNDASSFKLPLDLLRGRSSWFHRHSTELTKRVALARGHTIVAMKILIFWMYTNRIVAPEIDTSPRGIKWPGMDIFDSYAPALGRRRNEKKYASVLQHVEATGYVKQPIDSFWEGPPPLKFQERSKYTDWLEAYKLADFLEMRAAQNDIMKMMCTITMERKPPFSGKDLDFAWGFNDALNHFMLDAIHLYLRHKYADPTEPRFDGKVLDAEFLLAYYKAGYARDMLGRKTAIEAWQEYEEEYGSWRIFV